MKLNEMNVVITGANGVVATTLMDYFSTRVAFVAGEIHAWLNIIGGLTMGNHVEEGRDD